MSIVKHGLARPLTAHLSRRFSPYEWPSTWTALRSGHKNSDRSVCILGIGNDDTAAPTSASSRYIHCNVSRFSRFEQRIRADRSRFLGAHHDTWISHFIHTPWRPWALVSLRFEKDPDKLLTAQVQAVGRTKAEGAKMRLGPPWSEGEASDLVDGGTFHAAMSL